MKQVVVNSCYGGFGNFTEEAVKLYKKIGGPLVFEKGNFCSEDYYSITKYKDEWISDSDVKVRTDPTLVKVVLELGEKASTLFSKHEVVEISDDAEYEISDYDGVETVYTIPVLRLRKLVDCSNDLEQLKDYLTANKVKFID